MEHSDWIKEFAGAITICDTEGKILSMNAMAVENFRKDGGEELIGKNVLDCHPEAARIKIKDIMEKRKPNIYTIEKGGKKKLIYQSPWSKDGRYAGLIELVLEIPPVMPHFVRDPLP